MAAPNTAFNAKIQVDDGSSNAFTDLAQVFSIDFPEEMTAKVKTTHLQTSNQHHTYTHGWTDCGVVKVTQYWSQSEMSRLIGIKAVTHNWKIIIPDTANGTYSFSGYCSTPKVTKLGTDDECVMMETDIQVCGAITAS